MKKYQLIYNESHSWIKVPVADIVALNINNEISRYSKIKGNYYYLETVFDAPFLESEATKQKWDIQISSESSR